MGSRENLKRGADMKFLAIRGKFAIDGEGEAKVTLIVSKLEAIKIHEIPTEALLEITVEEADNDTVGQI